MESLRGELSCAGLAGGAGSHTRGSRASWVWRKGKMAWQNCAPEAAQFVLFQDHSNEVENGDFFWWLWRFENNFGICVYREPGCFSVCREARQLSWSGRDRSCSRAGCSALCSLLLLRALMLAWPFEALQISKRSKPLYLFLLLGIFLQDRWAVSVYLQVRMKTGASFRKLGRPDKEGQGSRDSPSAATSC